MIDYAINDVSLSDLSRSSMLEPFVADISKIFQEFGFVSVRKTGAVQLGSFVLYALLPPRFPSNFVLFDRRSILH